jgi:predicted nucleic acid-binding protein
MDGMKKIFLDTNFLVYTVDRKEIVKFTQARKILDSFKRDFLGVISTQVLQEFASVALSKLSQSEDVVLQELIFFENFEVVTTSPSLIRRGVELRKEFQLHFWDATILAAAEHADCDVLYSEDFPAGAVYGNLRVENPLL